MFPFAVFFSVGAMMTPVLRIAPAYLAATNSEASNVELMRREWLCSVTTLAGLCSQSYEASAIQSDEYAFVVEDGGAGIEVSDLSRYLNELRVYVKRVLPGSAAEKSRIVEVGDILVSVNGISLETMDARRAKDTIVGAARPCTFVLRKPGLFVESLGGLKEGERVTTQIAPALNGDRALKQVISVEQLRAPERCTAHARKGDLLEIEYTGRLLDGTPFDGSAAKVNGEGVVGRGGDSSIYFALGQQPSGQFPPGWDVGLVGMCVGEKRALTVPAALAYGAAVSSKCRIKMTTTPH